MTDAHPTSSERRGSLRSETKKLQAAAATPTPKAKSAVKKKIPEKKSPEKKTSVKKSTEKAPTKRKTPSPSSDDMENATEVDEETSPSPPKKAKKSSPNTPSKKSHIAAAKRPENENEQEQNGDEILHTHITAALQAALPDPAAISAQITKGISAALAPYLRVLDPLMQFHMLCNNRSADTVLGMEIEKKRVEVLDIVRRLEGKGGDGDGEGRGEGVGSDVVLFGDEVGGQQEGGEDV